jgi:hypothetical protein
MKIKLSVRTRPLVSLLLEHLTNKQRLWAPTLYAKSNTIYNRGEHITPKDFLPKCRILLVVLFRLLQSPGSRLTAVGIRCAEHATPSTRKSWH